MIVGGIIMIFFPGDAATDSNSTLGGIVLLAFGLGSGVLMQVIAGPLMGMDPPMPVKAKSIKSHDKMKSWASAGMLEALPDGEPTEVRLRSVRVMLVRDGENAYATTALCPHARLPLASFPGMPLKAEPIKDGCVTCPFHGARFQLDNGKVVRQPFTSEFNADHPFLGRVQSKLMFFNKSAEDIQTFPVKIEDGEIFVGLPR